MHVRHRAHLHGQGEARQGRPVARSRDPRGDPGHHGVEDELTPEEIAEADAVILAVDIKIDRSRFEGKRVMEVPTSVVLKASKQIINKIEESLNA